MAYFSVSLIDCIVKYIVSTVVYRRVVLSIAGYGWEKLINVLEELSIVEYCWE